MVKFVIELSQELGEAMERRAAAAGFEKTEEYLAQVLADDVRDEDLGAPAHLSFDNKDKLEQFLEARVDDDRSFEPDEGFVDRLRERALHRRAKGASS